MSLVSVYIPTHNRSALLIRALESVLRQTHQQIEIIVVDDGSLDDTFEVVQRYIQHNANITYLKHEQAKGACAARNYALSIAQGEYITGLDDDDEFLPHHVAGLLKGFDEQYSFVAACLIEDSGSNKIERVLDCGVIELDSLLHYNKVGNQVFTLTSRLKAIGGFDESFPAFQDYDTWVRLVEKFGAGIKIKQASYVWHTSHEQARISNFPTKRLAALNMFITKHDKLMSAKHKNSLEVMRIRMASEPFSLYSFFKLVNSGNLKASVALYLNRNLTAFKKIIDRLRFAK